MGKQINEREVVLEILMEITENGAYSHKILGDVLSKYQYLEKRERAFITRVVEGTLEHMIEIDYILNQISKTKVKKMKPVIRNLLRSSVYQLKYMDSVPDHAVCSEAVKLAVRKGFSGLRGYVNGVLRNVVRKMDDIEYPKEDVQRLSVKYSVPEWILSLWKKEYGEEITEKMAADFQKEKPITIRCCLNRVTPEVLKEKLEAEGAKVEAHPYLPYAFYLSDYDYLEGLESFQEGLFAVQDISSMFVGELADPKAGDHVIDVCAAPGGKSLHVAEKLQLADEVAARENRTEEKTGRVEARDLTEYKTDLIWQNIDRSGLGNICAVCKDASVFDEYDKETADLVIADLPCSGLGVLGKKPDLKYRVQPEDLEELADLQRKILTCAQAIVKDGGPWKPVVRTRSVCICRISPIRWWVTRCMAAGRVRRRARPRSSSPRCVNSTVRRCTPPCCVCTTRSLALKWSGTRPSHRIWSSSSRRCVPILKPIRTILTGYD